MNNDTTFTPTLALPEGKKSTKIKAKFFEIVEKIGKRNLIIAGTTLLIAGAVLVNWMLFSPADTDTPIADTGTVLTDEQNEQLSPSVSTYFSATQISRQRARDEALEVLQSVVDSVDADEVAKNDALSGISVIADQIQKEANIESLICSKGFEQCVAVLSDNTATIVVSADSLSPAELAQINTVVYEQTGILPTGITIINK